MAKMGLIKRGRASYARRFAFALLGLFLLLLLWLALAYGELPHLWSKHEHRKIGSRDLIVSYTSQDIPADPINLRLAASRDAIDCTFRRAGWSLADPLSARSAIGIVASVILQRVYPNAPVSSLYFEDRLQDLAYEKDEGRTAHRRHHIRLWQFRPGQWVGAATYDRGIGLALFTLQVTHHIGPKVDAERDAVGSILQGHGARYVGSLPSRIPPGKWHRNGGGDRYITDGQIKVFELAKSC